jgi:hypothetical protein
LFLSSANLTEYAFKINMELGLLVTGGKLPGQVERQFERLIEAGQLVTIMPLRRAAVEGDPTARKEHEDRERQREKPLSSLIMRDQPGYCGAWFEQASITLRSDLHNFSCYAQPHAPNARPSPAQTSD